MNYKGISLTCTEEELELFINTIPVEIKVCDFTEKYNNMTIQNPTGVEDAKYYILKINGSVMLQPHDPTQQGYAPITDANAQSIIDTQKQGVIDNMVVEKFKVIEKTEMELLKEQVSQNSIDNTSIMEALADVYEAMLGGV